MQVDINKEPRLNELDNLFVLAAEGGDGPFPVSPELDGEISRLWKKSGFGGRKDESVTLVAENGPRKITLVGLGDRGNVNVRILKAAIRGLTRSAQKNNDTRIAVLFPYRLPMLDEAATTRAIRAPVRLTSRCRVTCQR